MLLRGLAGTNSTAVEEGEVWNAVCGWWRSVWWEESVERLYEGGVIPKGPWDLDETCLYFSV